MAARKTKKPAPRKSPSRSKGSIGKGNAIAGWIAASFAVGGWAISNGRPANYLAAVTTSMLGSDHRPAWSQLQSSIGQDERDTHHSSSTSRPPANPAFRPRMPALAPLPASAIFPLPKPKAQILAEPLLPSSAKLALAEPARSASSPVAATTAAGGERHATRTLAAYSAPDASSRKLAEIGSGSSVLVIRASGGWRYVRAMHSGEAGWVDGRFLAGEAAAGPPPADMTALRTLEAFRFAPGEATR